MRSEGKWDNTKIILKKNIINCIPEEKRQKKQALMTDTLREDTKKVPE